MNSFNIQTDSNIGAYGQQQIGGHHTHTSNITISQSNIVEDEDKDKGEKISEKDTLRFQEMFGNCSAINL